MRLARLISFVMATPPLLLHDQQEARRFQVSLVPPLASGMTWSAVVARLPQPGHWHTQPAAASTAKRLAL
jgi:hypothetical protein